MPVLKIIYDFGGGINAIVIEVVLNCRFNSNNIDKMHKVLSCRYQEMYIYTCA